MTEAEVRARLERMVSAGDQPTLASVEIDELLQAARRADTAGNPPFSSWRAANPYDVGQRVVPGPRNGHVYVVVTAGQTAAAAPAWPIGSGAQVTDGTVTWREDGLAPWAPTYDLDAAAAEGWRRKAGKVVAAFDVSLEGQSATRSQMHAHCMRQADAYASRSGGRSVRLPNRLLETAVPYRDQ